ncbi:hypothetical protein [Bradyrhizobium sp. AUGA SZCCT0182]|nr:hypothetical protein [Bradyrhizobium sp. AUGA SZCCT0182]
MPHRIMASSRPASYCTGMGRLKLALVPMRKPVGRVFDQVFR